MTRRNNKKNPMHGSTWLWGSDGTGAAFANTKICSLAAKGFGSFVPTSNPSQPSHSQTPTPTSSQTISVSQTSNDYTTPEMSLIQSSSSQIQLQLVQVEPTPTSLASGSVCTATSSSLGSTESVEPLNQKHSHLMTSSSPSVSQSQANITSPCSSSQQGLSTHAAYFQG